MLDKFDKAIQDIAIKHGVILSKDDPILNLQTMSEKLIEETRQMQAALLTQFKEEIENISSQWKDDAKEKAEKILNAALAGSKESMAKLLLESSRESVHAMKNMLSDSIAEARDLTQQTRKFSWFALFLSVIMLVVSGTIMFSKVSTLCNFC